MDDQTRPLEPWQWPDEHWKKLINHVRAGRSYRPKVWKNGARCAVALSFDSDHETNELRDGGKSVGRIAWGQYGNRVGLQLEHAAHREGDGHSLRLLAHGRRGLLRTDAGRRADGDRRAARRMDPRR